MLLAIDAGNSFIKWGYHDGVAWQTQGRVARAQWRAKPDAYLSRVPDRIIIANVAGPQVLAALHGIFPGIEIKNIQAQTQSQLKSNALSNRYQPAESLGADRWASLIAARALVQEACVVVSLGTAMTADALDSNGVFLGGIITPGRFLMRKALSEGTHALAQTAGNIKPFPTTTADAIESGVNLALLGAIEKLARELEQHAGKTVSCLLTGGDAAALSPWLNRPHQVVDNLVLQGLLLLAQDEGYK